MCTRLLLNNVCHNDRSMHTSILFVYVWLCMYLSIICMNICVLVSVYVWKDTYSALVWLASPSQVLVPWYFMYCNMFLYIIIHTMYISVLCMYEYNIIVFSYYFCLLGLLRLGFGIILYFMISTWNSALGLEKYNDSIYMHKHQRVTFSK